jgi:hypothetical protein
VTALQFASGSSAPTASQRRGDLSAPYRAVGELPARQDKLNEALEAFREGIAPNSNEIGRGTAGRLRDHRGYSIVHSTTVVRSRATWASPRCPTRAAVWTAIGALARLGTRVQGRP